MKEGQVEKDTRDSKVSELPGSTNEVTHCNRMKQRNGIEFARLHLKTLNPENKPCFSMVQCSSTFICQSRSGASNNVLKLLRPSRDRSVTGPLVKTGAWANVRQVNASLFEGGTPRFRSMDAITEIPNSSWTRIKTYIRVYVRAFGLALKPILKSISEPTLELALEPISTVITLFDQAKLSQIERPSLSMSIAFEGSNDRARRSESRNKLTTGGSPVLHKDFELHNSYECMCLLCRRAIGGIAVQYAAKHAEQSHLVEQMNTKYYYYTRTQGLFRICYPKERPPTVQTYLSPVETHCMNINYFIPDEENLTRGFSDDAMTRLHMGRSVIALFIVGFVAIFTAFWTGVVGCWKRSPGNITATAILMLLACLLSASAMGLWHGVEYYEKEKIVGEEYYQQWSNSIDPNSCKDQRQWHQKRESGLRRRCIDVYRDICPQVLRDNTVQWYGWSFYLAWLGVATCLGTMTLFLIAASCLRREHAREQAQNVLKDNSLISYDWSYVVAWVGVGWSLVSAILFSAAAICLRGERMREEAMNMQYLMPVYPQKQQYAYAGYPAPAAYPGPYYHGSQYGPYNY
ncbi:hypothetical protein WN48_02281 [Eufriesea mexicana]|nr:hypothetical protein WN48_02281 [Eufriesea mexicana]